MRTTKRHVVTSAAEHVAVLECCKYLEEVHGMEITHVGVNEYGEVDPEQVRAAIREDTALVTSILSWVAGAT